MVNQLASDGKLTAPYVSTMRKQLREQLQSLESALEQPDSTYAAEMRAGLREPDNASPALLREHAEKLKAMETALESA